jgi:hypothetical protein
MCRGWCGHDTMAGSTRRCPRSRSPPSPSTGRSRITLDVGRAQLVEPFAHILLAAQATAEAAVEEFLTRLLRPTEARSDQRRG